MARLQDCIRRDVLLDDETEGLSQRVIGGAIRVHRTFGPGLLESAYKLPLAWALEEDGLHVEVERALSISFAGREVPRAYVIDLTVNGRLIVEVKAVQQLLPIHIAQVKTYLSLTSIQVGLLINFNVPCAFDLRGIFEASSSGSTPGGAARAGRGGGASRLRAGGRGGR